MQILRKRYHVVYKILKPKNKNEIYEIRSQEEKGYGHFQVHISGYMTKQKIKKTWKRVKQELEEIGFLNRFSDDEGVLLRDWSTYKEGTWMHSVLHVYKHEKDRLPPAWTDNY
jgi:hypothetical protein